MADIAFVYPSPASAAKGLFDNYNIDFNLDILFLCSEAKPKILKKDIDMDMSILDDYKLICPIGAESLKYVCGMTGITKYNGVFIENKYIPLINPALTEFRPQYIGEIQKAINKIKGLDFQRLSTEKIDKDYQYIKDQPTFLKFIETILKPAKEIAIDLESTSLSSKKGEIIGVVFTVCPHQAVFVDAHVVKKCSNEVQTAINDSTLIFHHAKFDIRWLQEHMELEFDFDKINDTMLLHYCLDETLGTHGLKQLALKFTDLGDYERGLEIFKKEWCRKNKILLKYFNYGMLPIEMLSTYAQKDGDATFQLYKKFRPLVEKNEKFKFLYETILLPATEALVTLEGNGGPIDWDSLVALDEDYEIDIEECINEISLDPDVQRFERIYGKTFNPNSTAQLRIVLFDLKKLTPLKKTEGGAWSVDKETLIMLDTPFTQCITDLREKVKMRGTYISNIMEGIDFDKRLRSSFNISGTTSGRLSSSGTLNYQNIPRDNKDIKNLFRARPGYVIIQGDLGNAEVYYAAALSNDAFLKKAFLEKLDFHGYIAKQIFNLPCHPNEVKKLYPEHRQRAKAITFGILYQAGPAKIAETASISVYEAKQFIAKYFREARNLKHFIDNSNSFIENHAFIYSFFGRKRRLPESRSPNRGVAGHAVRSGVNFLVQSVASDINLLGFIDAVRWIKENNYQEDIVPFTVVHDSVVAEVKEELVDLWASKVQEFMQADRGLAIENCPIRVDWEVGPTWGRMERFEIAA